MKKIIFLLLLASIFSCSLAFSAQHVVIYTYDVQPPFAFKDKQGNLTGVYIEIVKKAVSRMTDYTVSFKVVPWARAKHLVKEGKAFAILPPYFHAHDWLTDKEPKHPYIWPYSLSLFTQIDVVICNEKVLTKPRQRWPGDYEGLKFVMWRGDGRAGTEFFQMVKKKKIRLELLNSIKSTIGFIMLGRADCTVSSKLPFAWWVKKMKETGEYQKNDLGQKFKEAATISTNEGYLGYTDINAEKNFPFKKDFTIKFDIEIYKMKKSGELQKIIDSFIK